ncbi:MAG: carboxypeptidase-like regulatory domain-containing protein [Flavobacteriaceae bacterium]|nr:carboxypeptidase-like regulatory domain-containing protein [Flavobacteriaceae bacterium]
MKKQTLKTVLLLFTFINVYSQDIIISGIVKDSFGSPLQYVNVGILNKPIGTVTNHEGDFSLIIDESILLDTLKISRLGYKTETVILNESKNIFEITLFEKIETLEEVHLSSKKLKQYEKGKDKENTKLQVLFSNTYQKNSNLGTEIGRKFKLGDKNPSVLKSFKFYIKENDYKFSKFRINIYSLKKGLPFKRLNLAEIFTSVQDSYTGWVIVDLDPSNIIVQQDIIISVEWVEKSDEGKFLNMPMIAPSIGSTHYYKSGSQNKWGKMGGLSSSLLLTYEQ